MSIEGGVSESGAGKKSSRKGNAGDALCEAFQILSIFG